MELDHKEFLSLEPFLGSRREIHLLQIPKPNCNLQNLYYFQNFLKVSTSFVAMCHEKFSFQETAKYMVLYRDIEIKVSERYLSG